MSHEALLESLNRVAISPYNEVVAYEYLYSLKSSSLKKITAHTVLQKKLPTEALRDECGLFEAEGYGEVETFIDEKMGHFSVAINNTPSWPTKLADSQRPSPLFYYRGDIALIGSPSVSIVGARKASELGIKRAAKIAKEMVEAGYSVVSGLAKGIDTAAMRAAFSFNGNVIGVIGTPLDECYPKENKELQMTVQSRGLLVSQVPFFKYSRQPFSTKKLYFPERNELMAAISDATIIIEASDTSGTLTQANACLHQKRPLFILRSCVQNEQVTWPKRYVEQPGVYVIDTPRQVIDRLSGVGHG
ncbi:MAG: DNA-processing protein DprA [Raoultibacter sp.]